MGAENNRVIVVAGPTASGKSALAIELARALDGIIINADSMQHYRELRVLTARPSARDLAAAPHQLYGQLGLTDPPVTAHSWAETAEQCIAQAHAAGKTPILCGGSGLYLKAWRDGMAALPEIPPDIRAKCRQYGHAELEAVLAPLQQPFHDLHRMQRQWEVLVATGKPLAWWQQRAEHTGRKVQYIEIPDSGEGAQVLRHYENCSTSVLWCTLLPDRQWNYQQSEQRLSVMLAGGAIEEVAAMPSVPVEHPLQRALGVSEIRQYLAGDWNYQIMQKEIAKNVRRYIKRQHTWLKHTSTLV